MPAVAGVNDAGFFEPVRIVEVHDELLAAAGSSWHDTSPIPEAWFRTDTARSFADRLTVLAREQYGDGDLMVLKDPRMCRFIPLWLDILSRLEAQPLFVIPYRHPWEVAASLARRDGFSAAKSEVMWLQHLVLAEWGSRGHARAFLAYEDLLTDPRGTLIRVAQHLGIVWPQQSESAFDAARAFLSREHHHNRAAAEAAAPPVLLDNVAEAYALLEGFRGRADGVPEAALDRIREDYLAADRVLGPAVREIGAEASRLTGRLAERARDLVAAQATEEAARAQLSEALAGLAAAEAREAAAASTGEEIRAELHAASDALVKAGKEREAAVRRAREDLDARERILHQVRRDRDETVRQAREDVEARDKALLQVRREGDEALRQARAELEAREKALNELRREGDEALRQAQAELDARGKALLQVRQDRDEALRQARAELEARDRDLREARAEAQRRASEGGEARDKALREVAAAMAEVARLRREEAGLRSGLRELDRRLSVMFAGARNTGGRRVELAAEPPPDWRASLRQLGRVVAYLRNGAPLGWNPRVYFDSGYYLETNPWLWEAGLNPFEHFLGTGLTEHRDPCRLFRTEFYLEFNPEGAQSALPPFLHFLRVGDRQGLRCHPLFDPAYYRATYPDVAASRQGPWHHYVRSGAFEGRNPNPFFDAAYYRDENPVVRDLGLHPLDHYLRTGAAQGLNPHPRFDTAYYLASNPDVAAAGMNPLEHYVRFGRLEGRRPHPQFERMED